MICFDILHWKMIILIIVIVKSRAQNVFNWVDNLFYFQNLIGNEIIKTVINTVTPHRNRVVLLWVIYYN